MTLASGTKLGPYEIVAELGTGGMGEVYRARDPRLKRDVAIKVLPERFTRDKKALARFRRESLAVAALSHSNIRAIYDVGTDNGRIFAVMELMNGDTLAARMKSSALNWKEAVRIALETAEGLSAAHCKGIIHRDVKPRNIFLSGEPGAERVKLLDFGVARLESNGAERVQDSTATQTAETAPGVIIGTVAYMSPEQVRGQTADPRSDIFAFGCMLHEMLTGIRPFARPTFAETVAAILRDAPPSLSESEVDLPGELDRVITHCLEKEAPQRFQSMRDVAFALRRITEDAQASRTNDGMQASVVVLPFVNMSSNQENEYLCDGLAEELINALCKIDGLRVASRTSAFAFKGKDLDIREIAKRLNVWAVLEGSVRSWGTRLRITAQLVDAVDGYHLWSETFDRQMEDVFAVQDEIAREVTQALQVVLSEDEKRLISRVPTASVEAYECYLRGRQFFHHFRRVAVERACSLFTQACEHDAEYASAYAGIADCCSALYTYWGADDSVLLEANEASWKALELDPELAQAHVARASALALSKRYDDAREEFETAIRLDPGLFDAYYFFARACYEQGKLEEAAALFSQASLTNPEDFQAQSLAATSYAGLGRQDDFEAASSRALDAIERRLELYPRDARALYMGAIIHVHAGEGERGLEWAERALAADPEEPLVPYNVACTYALLGQREKAIDCIESAVNLGGSWREWIENDPDLDSLRDYPRFQALLERLER
ncbi:MAG: protein kinase domain-containing protein [Planctomycetota bacterium]|jgi:serine/threonine protein kinase/tetratricopeptide (TPR) repeat protein